MPALSFTPEHDDNPPKRGRYPGGGALVVLSSCPGERGWVRSQGQDLPVKGCIEALSSSTSLICEEGAEERVGM